MTAPIIPFIPPPVNDPAKDGLELVRAFYPINGPYLRRNIIDLAQRAYQ